MKWRINYENDTGPGDDSFREWWVVTDGEKYFEAGNKEDAEWLCNLLNAQ